MFCDSLPSKIIVDRLRVAYEDEAAIIVEKLRADGRYAKEKGGEARS